MPPPYDDVSLASVANPLEAGGAGEEERASPGISRRVEAGSIMGVESPVLAPVSVAELAEGGSHALAAAGRLLDGTT
jgi:hypothetical protein